MRLVLFIIPLLLCGCDALQLDGSRQPDDSYVEPLYSTKVVMASELWCAACRQQEAILQPLVDSGEIELEIVSSKHPTYKARVLPTLYVCTDRGCKKLEGVQSVESVQKAARD